MSGLHNGRYLVSEQDKEHFKQKGCVHHFARSIRSNLFSSVLPSIVFLLLKVLGFLVSRYVHLKAVIQEEELQDIIQPVKNSLTC